MDDKMKAPVKQIEVPQTYSAEMAFGSMNKFRKIKKFCDTNIIINNAEYPAHKVVLASFSPFFETMFSADFSEAKEPNVTLKFIDESAMEVILEYAYLNKIELTESNIQSVLRAAHFLQAYPLLNMCCDVLANTLNAENCLSIWSLAETYGNQPLQVKAHQYISANFSRVCEVPEFLEQESETLINFIKNDWLNVDKEETIFDAVLRWFYYKECERKKHLERVLREVRLMHMDFHFLNDRFEENKALRDSPSLIKLWLEVSNYHALPHRRMDLQSAMTRKRFGDETPPFQIMVVIYKINGVIGKRWLSLTEDGRVLIRRQHPSEKAEHSYNAHNCKLLQYSSDYSSFSEWDYTSEGWSVATTWSALEGRTNIRFCVLDGSWYAVGGQQADGKVCSRLERYDRPSGDWVAVAPLPFGVYSAAVVSFEGTLYVIGGTTGDGLPSLLVQRYHLRTDSWTQSPPFPELILSPSACVLNKQIYVFSQKSGNKVYVYDMVTETWDNMEMPYSFVFGPVLLNGSVFVIARKGDEKRIVRYSPRRREWRDFAVFSKIQPTAFIGPLLFKRRDEDPERNCAGPRHDVLFAGVTRNSNSIPARRTS